jgi:hypothetical protein
MYGSTVPFRLGLLQSVVGDTAMPPDDWSGLAKACLSRGLPAVENRFYRVMSGAGKLIWPMKCISLQICLWEEDFLEA